MVLVAIVLVMLVEVVMVVVVVVVSVVSGIAVRGGDACGNYSRLYNVGDACLLGTWRRERERERERE